MATRSAQLTVAFPDSVLDQLRKEAEALGISAGELVRRRVDRYPVAYEYAWCYSVESRSTSSSDPLDALLAQEGRQPCVLED